QSEQRIELVPLEQIIPLPGNITVMGREEDMMLRTDMTRLESKGLYRIDPILLRRLSSEEIAQIKAKQSWTQAKYQIIDGHSRWRAARELGWTQIRAIIIDCTLEEAYAINYMKNKARGTVDPMREAAYFRYLHEVKKMRVDQIAEKFGISHREVDRILSRIKVSEEARKKLSEVPTLALSPSHYEIIGSVHEPEKQREIAEIIAKEELSVREAQVAKEAIEKGLPPEKAVKVVEVVKREKLTPKEARKVVRALAVKPEAEQILGLPKEKLVEQAEKIVAPPPQKTPEEIIFERAEEARKHYPPIVVDYVVTRYKGKHLEDVLKAVFWTLWSRLDEAGRESITAEAIRLAGEKGFVQPIVG
ncbi:MAG: ParB/RepB/Spo0J family partition protein, partial [Candidatus Bathyarchaeales archaeon]